MCLLNVSDIIIYSSSKVWWNLLLWLLFVGITFLKSLNTFLVCQFSFLMEGPFFSFIGLFRDIVEIVCFKHGVDLFAHPFTLATDHFDKSGTKFFTYFHQLFLHTLFVANLKFAHLSRFIIHLSPYHLQKLKEMRFGFLVFGARAYRRLTDPQMKLFDSSPQNLAIIVAFLLLKFAIFFFFFWYFRIDLIFPFLFNYLVFL